MISSGAAAASIADGWAYGSNRRGEVMGIKERKTKPLIEYFNHSGRQQEIHTVMLTTIMSRPFHH